MVDKPTLSFDRSMTLEQILEVRRSERNPSVGRIFATALKEGRTIFKIATLMEIIDIKNGGLHHHVLKIETIRKDKEGWRVLEHRSVNLENDDPREIDALMRFVELSSTPVEAPSPGRYKVIGEDKHDRIQQLLDAAAGSPAQRIELLARLFRAVPSAELEASKLVEALEVANSEALTALAAAAKLVEYRKAIVRLKDLVRTSKREPDFQSLLAANPWMFGSEYSESLGRRNWTRDQQLDFMLRRTVDDYLEIVEIKTPEPAALFVFDGSHNSYYPAAHLSKAIGQVLGYIQTIDADRNRILAEDNQDPLKIRARIIMGRDGDDEHRVALRNLNAHLHRVEVITYDQLVRIASRVLGAFSEDSRKVRR